jgi:hypothetical protein
MHRIQLHFQNTELDVVTRTTKWAALATFEMGGKPHYLPDQNPIILEVTGLDYEQLDRLVDGLTMQCEILGGTVAVIAQEVDDVSAPSA